MPNIKHKLTDYTLIDKPHAGQKITKVAEQFQDHHIDSAYHEIQSFDPFNLTITPAKDHQFRPVVHMYSLYPLRMKKVR